MDSMTIYSLPSWIAVGVNCVFGVYVLKKDYKSPVNRLFFLFLLGLITWSFGWAMMLNEGVKEKALFWAKFACFGLSLCPAIYLHLTFLFPVRKIYSLKNYPLILAYLVGVAFLSVSFSGFLLKDVKWLADFGIYTCEFGILYPLYIGFYTICFCWGILNLIRSLKEARSNREQLQSKYLICGIIILFILSFISDISSFSLKYPFSS
ncbi:MAG: histidine kinase N-terminal 7TM domain-containing protein [bacterium]